MTKGAANHSSLYAPVILEQGWQKCIADVIAVYIE